MPLATGTKLGSYEILGAIGAGGMGEVFRARDTKLQRDVALKILPSVFALDFDRLARFKREAHVLACLNHPNIAAIHGFEDSTDPQALALELVEGPTLADRIAKGPIPLDEVVPIARQICDALESAHEQGIVHRDLKPANIKVRADGTVKVLDFGLAKALEQTTAGGGDATASPTITSPALTRLGLILGTAAYMSPEQARGRAADKRSDIWAFGCVLYEMLTGKRTFDGEEISDTLASVLKSEPDWSALPAKLPAPIRSLVEGCLKRDRRDRIGNISTARFLLNQPLIPSKAADVIQTAPQPVWRRAALVAVGVATGAAVVAGIWNLRPSTVSPVTRFEFALPHGQQLTLPRQAVAISPDGSHIAYSADGRLYLRSMAALEPLAIAGTENGVNPVFAPDGQSLVFWVDSSIKRIALTGGVPVTICRTGTAPSSISWSKEGILFPQPGAGIMRVSENGGEPEPLVPLSRPEGRAHGPQMLPDGNTVLFTSPKEASVGDDIWDRARIVVHSLTTGTRKTVIDPGTDARYVPSGHIVYALGGTLFAVRFNLDKLEVVGGPVPVVEGVRRSTAAVSGSAHFDFSGSGSLVYLPGPASMGAQDLFLFDRKRNWEALKLPPGTYRYPRVSPDGKRVAVESSDDKEAFISVYDLSGTSSPRRLTFGSNNRFPIWSADGKRVAFQSDRNRSPAIFWQPIDGGPAEPLTKADPGTSHVPEAWSPVSDVVLFSIAKGAAILLWTGRVLTPSDDGYDAARSVFNAMIDRRPVLVVRCTNDDDVVAAVAVAREQNALVSVKCTGHNVAGFAVCDGGLAIDLSLMKSISVDPVGRTVRVGAGCTWGEVNDALQPHSLAAAGGFVSLTGVSGLTLGGGLGWLVRKHGLALDNLISARVVLADGRVVTASASENDDLFWALRGGGGNFGIVTEFEFRVHEGGSVLAGIALHPFAAARDVLRRWRDLEATAPEEFSGSALLLTFPQDPNAPEPLRGAALVGVGGVYAGAGPAAETAVGSLRAYGPPIADLFKVTPYNEVQRMADFAFPLGFRNYWKSSYLKGMSDGAIDVLVDHFERVPSPNTVIVLEHNGDGALERVPETATAFGHRGWPYNFIVTSAWSNPAETERNVTWTRELFAAMRPFMADALYVNYIGDEGADGVRAAYGSKYERLAMLKAKYDPDNLFRMNQNIKPAVGVTHAGA